MSDDEVWLSPGEMAQRSGASIDTLRYYERESLITGVRRASSGHRRYSAADVGWIDVLRCLRLTGMSIGQLKAFAALGRQGRTTEAERHRQLTEHRQRVEATIAELRGALVVIDAKIETYAGAMSVSGERA